MAAYYLIFAQMLFDICLEVKYFDLSYRGLLFASTTNLEAALPIFAKYKATQNFILTFDFGVLELSSRYQNDSNH